MSCKLIFFAGSARKESLNGMVACNALKMAEAAGAEATFIDLHDLDMPIYDGDYEAKHGLPEGAKKLKKLFIESDGFFIASPEYNSSFSPLLKNSLDWISRPSEEGEEPLIAYKGKVAAIASASPGGLGGIRGLPGLRMLLSNINVLVIPQQLAIGNAFDRINKDGDITDDKTKSMLENVVKELVRVTNAVKQ